MAITWQNRGKVIDAKYITAEAEALRAIAEQLDRLNGNIERIIHDEDGIPELAVYAREATA